MTTANLIKQFQSNWSSQHPDRKSVIVEIPPGQPLPPGEYINMTRFKTLFRVKLEGALKILQQENVTLHIRHEGKRIRYEISAADIPRLLERHGTEEARAHRRARPFLRRGEPLPQVCRFCGKIGGQWRHHVDVNGLVHAICSSCRKIYGSILLSDGSKLACPQCGETDKQIRFFPAVNGLQVICGHCMAHYGVPRLGPKSIRNTRKTYRPSAKQLEIEHQLAIDEFFRGGAAESPDDRTQISQPASPTLKSGESTSKQAERHTACIDRY